MKKKAEKAHFDELWDGLAGHLTAFVAAGDQEELHLFRVRVKKIGALLALLDFDSPQHQLSKEFKPVRKIFKHCGLIRNAYINLQLGERYHIDNEQFKNSQQLIIENGALELKALEKKYLKTLKRVYERIGGNLKIVSNYSINEFYNENLKEVACTLNQLEFTEALHKARKRIKTLMYNRKIAQNALAGKLQVNNEYLDQLQESIGDWHDNMLAIELFSAPELNDRPVVTRIKRQNTKLKKSIAILVRGFMNRATLPVNALNTPQK